MPKSLFPLTLSHMSSVNPFSPAGCSQSLASPWTALDCSRTRRPETGQCRRAQTGGRRGGRQRGAGTEGVSPPRWALLQACPANSTASATCQWAVVAEAAAPSWLCRHLLAKSAGCREVWEVRNNVGCYTGSSYVYTSFVLVTGLLLRGQSVFVTQLSSWC